MISLQNVGMSYGERDLFTGVSLQLNENTRYGITGANGSGKSTLLKILARRDQPSEGKIDIQKGTRIAYLEQNLPLDSGETAIQIVIGGDEILAKALAERDKPDADPAHAGEIEEIIMSREGYRAESEAARLLSGLGLPDEVHTIPANKLSGGQLMRVLLARALFAKGEVLLLDEPTNHLDMPGIKWLENFILYEFQGTLLLITHDRGFLSALSEQILDVDYKTITIFNMNYNRFVGARTLAAEQKEREAEAAKKKGIKVYHLNIGQPDIETPKQCLDAVRYSDFKVLEYSHSAGNESYRKKLVQYYKKVGINITPEQIIITTGGSEAIIFGFMACMDAGDEVIIPEPFYANYNGFAVAAGVKVVPVTSSIRNGFALPPIADFESKITSRTKAIVICNPNNPTGYLYSKAEMEQLKALILKHNLFLFSDEAYKEFCYDDQTHVSAMHLQGMENNVILMDTISKRYSACGGRIGAFITKNKES